VGVKRQWCGHRGKVDNCQVGVFMGYVSHHNHVLLDFRLSLPEGVGTRRATTPGMPRAA
jgi:SRSO17 transposase